MKKKYSCKDDYDPNSILIEEALKVIKNISKKITAYQIINLKDSYNRILYENIKSKIKVPNYNNSAMDGYALNIKYTKKNNIFKVVGTALAGKSYTGKIKENECIKIMTGAVIPKSCNVVIMKEETITIKKNTIKIISNDIKINQNIRFAGEDIKLNKILLRKNERIDPSIMGVLASQGIHKIKVLKKPKIAFFTSGDEIIDIKNRLPQGKLYDSNRYTLIGMLLKLDVEIIDLGHSKDNINEIKLKFKEAINCSDIVITTGGVSVGDADYIKEVVKKIGKINFWKVAIKPGRPLAFGKLKDTIFFGLPGNPVSVMITFLLFVLPSIKILTNEKHDLDVEEAILESNLKKRPGRVEFQRGIFYKKNNKTYVKSVGEQGSGILSSMSNANCLIYLLLNQTIVEKDCKVKIIKFKNYI